MIKAKLLNSDAELNSFFELSTLEYTPGGNLDVVVRLFSAQRGIRLIPENPAATVTLKFQTNNDTTPVLEKAATVISSDDRSMWKVSLSQAETETLIASNIEVELNSDGAGTVISKTVIGNVLSRQILSGDC